MSDTAVEAAQDQGLVRQILPLMSRHTVDFRPKSYAVWYAYVADVNADLKREIDRHIDQGKRLSGEATLDLYSRHLVGKAESDVAAAQDQLMALLAKAHDEIHSAGSETSRFNAHLNEFGAVLNDPEDAERLKAEVQNMAGETSRIHTAIDGLLTSVRESQAEVARLSLELTRAKNDANTDALTGLSNRRAFDQALLDLTKRRGSQSLSLVMLDIDHFKKVNDTFGHPYGDFVIATVARIVHANIRGRDVAARYGGEEFGILLIDTDETGAAMVADRIREQIAHTCFKDKDGTQAKQITASCGVAEHGNGELPEGMLGRADRALYRSKSAGRNRVTRASG